MTRGYAEATKGAIHHEDEWKNIPMRLASGGTTPKCVCMTGQSLNYSCNMQATILVGGAPHCHHHAAARALREKMTPETPKTGFGNGYQDGHISWAGTNSTRGRSY